MNYTHGDLELRISFPVLYRPNVPGYKGYFARKMVTSSWIKEFRSGSDSMGYAKWFIYVQGVSRLILKVIRLIVAQVKLSALVCLRLPTCFSSSSMRLIGWYFPCQKPQSILFYLLCAVQSHCLLLILFTRAFSSRFSYFLFILDLLFSTLIFFDDVPWLQALPVTGYMSSGPSLAMCFPDGISTSVTVTLC